MKTKGKTTSTDALQVLKRQYYRTAERKIALEEARVNAEAARLIHKLRTDAGLSQRQMASLIGTTQSVIS